MFGSGDVSVDEILDVDTLFIAKGCERRSHVLDWSLRIDKAIYASAADICIGDMQDIPMIQLTKKTHCCPITYLRVFRWDEKIDKESLDFTISGDKNGLIAIHSVRIQEKSIEIQCIKEIPNAKAKVCCCCSGYIQRKTDNHFSGVFAYSWLDQPVRICCALITENDCTVYETFDLNTNPELPLCTEIFHFKEFVFIAVGKTDSTIQLFAVNEDNKEWQNLTLHGHCNWVTDLAIKYCNQDNDNECTQSEILMASSGQDNVIRLWRISFTGPLVSNQDAESSSLMSIEFIVLMNNKYVLIAKLEAVLSGHEDWVVSVNWHPYSLQLLSASADKSLIVWEQSIGNNGLWLEKVRVGEVGGQASGYNGGCYSADGSTILAVSYFGGFYAWCCDKQESAIFKPCAAFGGHSMGVCDLDWDPTGTYLLSCSLDQTARCFAPTFKGGYAEVARPQVHGHDFNCIAFLSSSSYISGSEEKILRIFRAPLLFAKSLSEISGFSLDQIFPDLSILAEGGALMPALGLSNKQVEDDLQLPFSDSTKENLEIFVSPTVLKDLPTEDRLMQSTLWPEQQKLYGHGFEVFSVAVNYSGSQLASASKASQRDHASILLWDTTTWKNKVSLIAHNLTVTQMEFSHNDRMLASVSRDRTFSIFLRSAGDPWDWNVMYRSNERGGVHSRIIWSCSWTADDEFLATCSRDKKLATWHVDSSSQTVLYCTDKLFSAPLTAVSFCKCWKKRGYLLAVGQEDGIISIYWTLNKELKCLKVLDYSEGHSSTVKRLRFRPKSGAWSSVEEDDTYVLASASLDNSVKVHSLTFKI